MGNQVQNKNVLF